MIKNILIPPNILVKTSSFTKTVNIMAVISPPSRKLCAGLRNCKTTDEIVNIEQKRMTIKVFSLNIKASFAQSKWFLFIKRRKMYKE